MKNKTLLSAIAFFIGLHCSVSGQVEPPQPVGPVPNENQISWQQMEFYAFIHLSVNTYTDMAWGKGDEDPKIFDPAALNCRQWVRICKAAGMKGIILTAKHHSGFCLWPSKYTSYSVKNSPWKNGKGDIVRELSDACREYGLKFGVYLSPWDRNSADYGKPAYITYFRNQLRELLTNYGDIFEIWFDGANGGSGYYGGANEVRKIDRNTYYDWKNTYALVRSLQPNIVIWNDGGDRADLRWVGTEAGYVGETNWSLLNATGDVPDTMLRSGLENGNTWVPAEVNTSIRPEWFYHKKEDSKVKTLPQLMEIYYNSIGRNGSLLLNFPIMPNGLIHEKDKKIVLQFAGAIKKAFAVNLAKGTKVEASDIRGNNRRFGADKVIDESKESYWTTNDNIKTASLTINFSKAVSFNRFLIQEYIRLGQRVKSFIVEARINGKWKAITTGTTIGYKRILRFKTIQATKLRVIITAAKSCPVISNIGVYDAPQLLAAPAVIREQSGDVKIIPADVESRVYYTLDGSTPTIQSPRYAGPLKTQDGKIVVKCLAYDPITKTNSTITEEKFDVSRKLWKIIGIDDDKAYNIIDGNTATQWYQDKKMKMPVDLVIDLGKVENVSGFKYLPDQNWWAAGIISRYSLFISQDGNEWTQIDTGEFANIKNNPLWQSKTFVPVKARYVKLQALGNTQEDNVAGYAEVDIITR